MKKQVYELCPHCKKEVALLWDTETDGFEAVCPYCGKKLMLCSECLQTVCEDGQHIDCNWCKPMQLCHRCKELSAPSDKEDGDIRTYAYDKFKVYWCLTHDVTLADLFAKYSEYWGEVESDEDGMPDFWSWLEETGFAGGLIWPCRNEFLENEYLDSSLMLQLIPDNSKFRLYLRDIIRQGITYKEV